MKSSRSYACLVLSLMLYFPLHAEPAAQPSDAATLPRPDSPVKIIQKVSAVFPFRLMHDGILRGEAKVVAEINPQGQLSDVLVVGYTHEDFATEALNTVKQWGFEPSFIDGEPGTSVLTVTFTFEVTGVYVQEVIGDTRTKDNRFERPYAYRAQKIETLDRKPARLSGEGPIYPKTWIQEGRNGAVTIQFYIDEEGRTRAPSMAAPGDNLLVASALEAIRTWRFEPPLHRGQPALVQAEQLFVFRLPEENRSNDKG